MAHPRKLIRHAVVDLLAAANTAAGARVSGTRTEPHRKTQLPAISVYTLRDVVDPASAQTAPVELQREVNVEIAGWVTDSAALPVDDAMDDLAEEIEAAMDADRYLGGAAGDSVLASTVMQVLEEDGGDPLIGVVTLTYSVTYYSSPTAGVLDDFLTATATQKVGGGVPDTVPIVDGPFVVQEIAP